MRVAISLLAVALLLSSAHADDPKDKARAKARAALAVAEAQRVREAVKAKADCLEDLAAATALAEKEGRPLFVWVGGCEKDLRAEFADAVHVHVKSWFGDAAKRLVIPRPGGKEKVYPNPTARDAGTIRAILTPKTSALSYGQASATAIREGKPLVVFAGIPAKEGPWVATEDASPIGWLSGPAVVVSVPINGGLAWVADLPPGATPEQIGAAITRFVSARAPVVSAVRAPVFLDNCRT